MLKLPKTKKVQLSNGRVNWEKTEADYLPVAARIAWFRREHPDWSILTKSVQLADKAVVMKAVIKDAPRPVTDVAETFADIGAIQALCGFEPKTPIEVGVPRFAAWFRHWMAA